ncbi:MmcQ/YjbR family DNA-binding protein [Deinococcus sonorensis]|uniref:MmcQ/YjbR family DNA-binding protein n=2 Tax=Deinococcus sonorensis TaxID=309891 RepID=A0AAU7UF91_9DEIO
MQSVPELRQACAALRGSTETFPFGPDTLVWKVGGRIYALCGLQDDPLTLSVKGVPEQAEQLRAEHPAIAPGYHLNKRHWHTLTLDGSLPGPLVLELLQGSYALVVAGLPRAVRATLG